MPNMWTHFIYGQTLLKKCNKAQLIADEQAIRVWNLGCQGPDFLFYHNYLPWKKMKRMNQLGSRIHNEHCGPLLLDMLRNLKADGRGLQEPVTLYLLGFLTHHVLDRNMHPYINFKSGFTKWNHQRFEIILDTIMVTKHLGLETWKTPVWRYFDVGNELPAFVVPLLEEAVARYFPDLAKDIVASDWHQAYRDMVQAQKWFHDPYGVKRVLSFGQTKPFVYKRRNAQLDYVNDAKQVWNDPTSLEEISTDSIWDLWNKALFDGEAVLTAAMDYLESGEKIGPLHANDLASITDLESHHPAYSRLVQQLGNISYETGKPCDSGLTTRYVQPIL